MSVNRHLSRTVAMQTLYEWDFRPGLSLQEIVTRNINIYPDDVDKGYVIRIVEGVKEKAEEIDKMIMDVAPEFPIDQISSIDKAVLRLAIFELLYDDDVPPKVAINEAVELGKTFGGENSFKFINGVLGTLYRTSDKFDTKEDLVASEELKTNEEVKTETVEPAELPIEPIDE